MKSAIFSDPVLAGREQKLEELRHYLTQVIQVYETQFCFVEAGVGKTRLIRTFETIKKPQLLLHPCFLFKPGFIAARELQLI